LKWVAQPKQYDFLTATEYAVLFGGARGGGKTDALLAEQITRRMEHPKSNGLFIRRTFAQLNGVGSAIPRSHEFLHGHAHWSESESRWTFRNGSVLKFGHLSDAQAIHNYLGSQADDISIDQAEQISFEEYTMLKGANRATVDGIVPHMRLSANPGGLGHGWVKATFIDAAPAGTAYQLNLGTEANPVWISHRFVPSKVYDNQALMERDPNYINNLRSTGGALAQAWIEGIWDQFSGQYFPEWNPDVHVIAPFKVPEEWPRWHATDYGYSGYSCTLWLTRSPIGRIYVYRERYDHQVTAEQQALTIRLWSAGERFRNRVLDPSCWGTESNGRTIADQFAAAGVPMAKATNSRLAGWNKLRTMLAWTAAHQEMDIGSGQMMPIGAQAPQLQVFSSCKNLIRTLPTMIHNPDDPEDMRKKGMEDHASDTLRYGVMALDVQPDKRQRSAQPYSMGTRRHTQGYVMRKRTPV